MGKVFWSRDWCKMPPCLTLIFTDEPRSSPIRLLRPILFKSWRNKHSYIFSKSYTVNAARTLIGHFDMSLNLVTASTDSHCSFFLLKLYLSWQTWMTHAFLINTIKTKFWKPRFYCHACTILLFTAWLVSVRTTCNFKRNVREYALSAVRPDALHALKKNYRIKWRKSGRACFGFLKVHCFHFLLIAFLTFLLLNWSNWATRAVRRNVDSRRGVGQTEHNTATCTLTSPKTFSVAIVHI